MTVQYFLPKLDMYVYVIMKPLGYTHTVSSALVFMESGSHSRIGLLNLHRTAEQGDIIIGLSSPQLSLYFLIH